MRIAIIIAGALIAYAINPELWRNMDPPVSVTMGFLFLSLVLLTLDLVEFGHGQRQ